MVDHRSKANGHVYRESKKRFIRNADPICGICGGIVDKTLQYPDPGSPTVDHIIPLIHGGHPTSLDNWSLTHWHCNRQKGDKLVQPEIPVTTSRDNQRQAATCNYPHHMSRQHWPEQLAEPCPSSNLLHHAASQCEVALSQGFSGGR